MTETKTGTIHWLWGKKLLKPIEYTYSWELSDNLVEDKKRQRLARMKAIQHVINYMGMDDTCTH